MIAPTKIPIGRLVQALLVLVVLSILINPELRVLVLFANAIGFDIAVLLLVLQLRSLPGILAPAMHGLLAFACNLASRLGSFALAAYPKAVALRRFDRLLCPVLIGMSHGLRCRPTLPARP